MPCGASAQQASSLEPKVRFETSAGDFVVQLDTVRAPLTAENFLRYVRDGFYNGLILHRVVANFVVQGGGFLPDFKPRTTRASIPNESGNGLPNQRGSIGMARGESPHSATSQFYVNVKDNPGLNPLPSRWGFAVFGQVVEGMDVIDRVAYVPTGERAGFADTPLEPIVIRRASVVGETAPPSAAPEPPPADTPAAGEAGEAGETGQADPAGGEDPGTPAADPEA
jgi:cyclophilin family peptidyl-prolyl cis-trans isomerase